MFKRISALVVPAAALAIVASPSFGAVAPIEGTTLDGFGPTVWDPVNQDIESWSCSLLEDDHYVPVEDGSFGATTDAFDGGFMLKVNTAYFEDPDGNGDLSGETLKVGPATDAGLSVSTTARALQTSPTLQYLVKLKNPSSHNLNRKVQLGSDLGSDANSTVVSTSSGDAAQTPRDRWMISNGDVSDPVVTQVYSGKRAAVRVNSVVHAPGGASDKECSIVDFKVSVPGKNTVYLLFFAQMHDKTDIGAGFVESKADAGKFNKTGLSPKLLNGIPNNVQNKIVNWHLT